MNIENNFSSKTAASNAKIGSNGKQYDTITINAVWEKANKEFGFFFFKRDQFGTIIAKHDYGEKTQYGWEIIHIIPDSQGGTNEIDNLQPIHWKNASMKGEQYRQQPLKS